MKRVIEGVGSEQITNIDKSNIFDGVERRFKTPSQAKNFLQTMSQLFE
jgi:hypothetical protein